MGYKSLFDYAVNELKYSEGQASRRIQAMRLIKDLPVIEAKIADGTLSLSNVQQAQNFFRNLQIAEPRNVIRPQDKLDVLAQLENKSVRDAQKKLAEINSIQAMPKERERVITETAIEVKFVMTDKLKTKLDDARALLGPKGAQMSYAELFESLTDLSLEALEKKRFGQKRIEAEKKAGAAEALSIAEKQNHLPKKSAVLAASKVKVQQTKINTANEKSNARYISADLKRQIWKRDRGQCVQCHSKHNVQYDHVIPVAMGGLSRLDNLRLLCFHCNQRASEKIFGLRKSTVRPGLCVDSSPHSPARGDPCLE
ncbi:MAG: HNH endonuclease signature motif containing protein [Proteobacteria bacterium]|nr:HNH endonuclease signature motif containing protein [Pseudomonadota bacterium]